VKTRGMDTILIVTRSAMFADILAAMVVAAGFRPLFPAGTESVALTMTRTQPRVVICDCSNPVDNIQRFLVEVSSRALPLMLCEPLDVPAIDREVATAKRVVWFTLPISREAFTALIERLLDPVLDEVHRVTATIGGISIDAGIRVRPLPVFPTTTGVYGIVRPPTAGLGRLEGGPRTK
jgi:hypothetical protein